MGSFLINGILVVDVKMAQTYSNTDGTAGILVNHTSGTRSTFPFPDSISANAAFNKVASIVGAINPNLPTMFSVSPNTFVSSVGATINVVGRNFDSSCLIFLSNVLDSSLSFPTSAVFNSPNSYSLIFNANAVPTGTWNIIYEDKYGNVCSLPNALIVT